MRRWLTILPIYWGLVFIFWSDLQAWEIDFPKWVSLSFQNPRILLVPSLRSLTASSPGNVSFQSLPSSSSRNAHSVQMPLALSHSGQSPSSCLVLFKYTCKNARLKHKHDPVSTLTYNLWMARHCLPEETQAISSDILEGKHHAAYPFWASGIRMISMGNISLYVQAKFRGGNADEWEVIKLWVLALIINKTRTVHKSMLVMTKDQIFWISICRVRLPLSPSMFYTLSLIPSFTQNR